MKILMIGSGPDRLGKAGELDRLAVQARGWLLDQGHQLVWLDSNPSAIMSRPVKGCRVYLEPLDLDTLVKLIELEMPHALIYDFGGRLAQHLTIFLEREGVLDRLQVEVLGTPVRSLRDFLDEQALHGIMERIGLPTTPIAVGRNYQEGLTLAGELGFPLLIKPSLALEGMGGRWLYNQDEVTQSIWSILHASPVREFIVQKPPLGWHLAGVELLQASVSHDSTRLLGTWEASPTSIEQHPGNTALHSPSQHLSNRLLSEAMQWANTLAHKTGLRGGLRLELGLAPEGKEARILRVRPGLNRLGAWLALMNRVPLGRLAAGLAQDLSWEEMAPIGLPASASLQAGRRLPRHFISQISQPNTSPTLAALGAQVQMTAEPAGASFGEISIMDRDKAHSATTRRDSEWLLILGPGPYQIGWGPELDLALWHTARHLKRAGKHLVLLNNNPDSASLDYDLFNEVCLADNNKDAVAGLLRRWPISGVIHQFCPSLSSELASLLDSCGVNLLGTPLPQRAQLSDWGQACRLMAQLGVPLRPHCLVYQAENAAENAGRLGYPVLARLTNSWINPAGEVLYSQEELVSWVHTQAENITPDAPLYLEKFQEEMVAAQVLGLADGQGAVSLGMLEAIEAYGVNSGDCAMALPPISLPAWVQEHAEGFLEAIAGHCKLVGHFMLELAITKDDCWVTRTWPFPSQHLPLVENALGRDPNAMAADVLAGGRLPSCHLATTPQGHMIKEAVFPPQFMSSQDPVLSPRMRSTGQVLGRNRTEGKAFYKSQLAVNPELPEEGCVFVSARDDEKLALLAICRKLLELGFQLMSTQGTAHFLQAHDLAVQEVCKLSEGRPNIVDMIKNGEICLAINIPGGMDSIHDETTIRLAAVERNLPLYTTIAGASLMVQGMAENRQSPPSLSPLEPVEQP